MHDYFPCPPGHRCVIDLDDPPADVPQELVDAGKKLFAAVFPTKQKGDDHQ